MSLDNSPALLKQLARYAHGIQWEHIPADVRRNAQFNILDTIGCIASGARMPESQQLMRAEARRGGPAEATVLGSSAKLPVEAATRINAYMGDIYELNDLIGGHASITTVTPALALAESLGSSGQALIEAVVTGIEIVCRVHGGFYAHQKPFTETAMVQVTIASAAGSAASAAKLMGLSEEQTMHAMAMAGALTSWGPAELVFGEGNSLKPILFGGWPGAMGLMAANYAREGLTGSSKLLESPIGYYSTVARAFDTDVVLDFKNWRLAQPRRKLHACCGYTHSAIDAVATLRREGLLAEVMNGGGRIRLHMPGYTMPAVAKHGQAPTTPNEARFNIEYCLAHAAVDTDVILPTHSNDLDRHLARPEIRHALSRIETLQEPSYGHYRFARIEVLNAAGEVVHSLYNDAPRGSEWNPMTEEGVRDKFRQLTGEFLSTDAQQAYLKRFDGLADSADCAWLLQAFQ